MRDTCGDENILYFDCHNVNILVLIYCTTVSHDAASGGNCVKGIRDLCIISYK